MKYLLAILIISAFSSEAYSQNRVERAVKNLQAGKLEKTQRQIDSARLDSTMATSSGYHYYKGHIYKELMKQQTPENAKPYGDIAIAALLKCLEHDDPSYTKSAERMLAFLFSRYYIHCTVLLDSDMNVALQYLKT